MSIDARPAPLSPSVAMVALRRAWDGQHYSIARDEQTITAVIEVARAAVEKSGVLARVAEWDQEDRAALGRHLGGRPATISQETALIAWFVLAMLRQNWHYSALTEHIQNVFTDRQLVLLGIPPETVRSQSTKVVYERLWRACNRLMALFDPEPGPRRKALTKAAYAELLAARALPETAPLLEVKRRRRVEVMNRIVGASTYLVPRDIRRKMRGSYAVDATVFPMPGRARTRSSSLAGTVYDAGWYVRTPEDATNGHDGSDALGNRRRTKSTTIWGAEVELIQAGRPTGTPDDYPLLIHGMNLHRPASAPAEYAAHAFRWMAQLDPEMPRDYIAADRLYLPNASPDTFQGPMRALGYRFAMDYPVTALGLQGHYGGAILVDGSWYCPSMPTALVEATADHAAGQIDTETLHKRINERNTYRVRPKQAADGDGYQKFRCPAAGPARTIDCSLKASALGHPVKRLLPMLLPRNPDVLCTNKDSVTIPPSAGLKYRQDFPYLSAEWHAAYHGPRNTVEGANRRVKSAGEENLGSSASRLARSLTAHCLFAVTAVVAANTTRVFTWLRQADGSDAATAAQVPPRRPGRRRDSLRRYVLRPDDDDPPDRRRERPAAA